MQVEMVVAGLTIDPVNNAPIVILREKEGGRIVPIWIGAVEASAIAFELEEIKLARPMTHDLLRGTIESLGGRVDRVAVIDLREGTYFAVVILTHNGKTIEIDARPSDAIALALRAKAPVLCESAVIEQAHMLEERQEAQKAREQQSAEPPPQAPPLPQSKEDEERGEGGPKPIVNTGTRTPEDLLESLKPEDFGKYKM
jgi:uncharacterized protein